MKQNKNKSLKIKVNERKVRVREIKQEKIYLKLKCQ